MLFSLFLALATRMRETLTPRSRGMVTVRLGALTRLESHLNRTFRSPERARLAANSVLTIGALTVAGSLTLSVLPSGATSLPLRSFISASTSEEVPPVPAAADEVKETTARQAEAAPKPENPRPRPAAAVAPAPPQNPSARGQLPAGKGMWIWLEDRAEGGDAARIVERANATGITHLYVRTGTKNGGFVGGPFLDRLLPVAHANGIRVYGWDFPFLKDPGREVDRAVAAINYTTPDGHKLDGFSPDIETPSEGVYLKMEHVSAYVRWLRENVGPNYPLIATVPNPTPQRLADGFPYDVVLEHMDAVAPMVYWQNRDPVSDVTRAITYLQQFGKPVFPIGQAYDGAPEGGPAGVPPRHQLIGFMQAAAANGATSVSFWSWQHANDEAWQAIADAAEFRLAPGSAEDLQPWMVRSYQVALNRAGVPAPVNGVFDAETSAALSEYQRRARLPVSGIVDQATYDMLMAPVAAPVRYLKLG